MPLEIVAKPTNHSRHVIAVKIVALQCGNPHAAINAASRNALSLIVVIFPDRVDRELAGGVAVGSKGMLPFAPIPAVIAAPFDDVDFFPVVLPNVAGPGDARLAVERQAPTVPKPYRK